ncbi:hypothetical protein FEM48_Zijuj04G0063600 [Ziziphus jujuba var. spinosa]|uniref:Zinc knuckle CX2CX4HX4C domain-containing protein n=1 Tax=Ziziphus jujuba var. spinosa TaxID=714518 RepID=A0A978VIA7_ZIZJJ|nr:hypothetical protein FEM48_Zijuj04G0063600 [Ziziphus jujuba var. spinosa]
MEDNIPTGVTGVPELRLTADEDSAKQISQCFLESVGVEPLRQMCSSFLLNRFMIEPESGHDGLGPLRDHISFCESEIHGLPLQFMTRDNAIKIGSLFKQVLQCNSSSHTNIIGMKYMRLRVKVDVEKPIPTGFLQKFDQGGAWVQFCYERLVEFCYNCEIIGHGQATRKLSTSGNQATNGALYGPWLGKIFDSLSKDTNTDTKNGEGEVKLVVSDPDSDDQEPEQEEGTESTYDRVSDRVRLREGDERKSHAEPGQTITPTSKDHVHGKDVLGEERHLPTDKV